MPIETRAAPSSPNNLYFLDVAGGRHVSLTLLFHSAITGGGVLGGVRDRDRDGTGGPRKIGLEAGRGRVRNLKFLSGQVLGFSQNF